jgi:hypothetical protein
MLVYYEEFGHIGEAIAREKEIKGWSRAKKLALILAQNPLWADLSEGWYPQDEWPLPDLKFAPQDGLRFSPGGGAGPSLRAASHVGRSSV